MTQTSMRMCEDKIPCGTLRVSQRPKKIRQFDAIIVPKLLPSTTDIRPPPDQRDRNEDLDPKHPCATQVKTAV